MLRDLAVAYRFRRVSERDVIFASYPKCGSTWLTFMLSDLLWGAGEHQEITDSRYIPGVGGEHLGQHRLPSGGLLLRTHERYRPCCKKAIYVVRDGRDAAVSLYFHIQRVTGMEASFSEFLEHFLRGSFVGAGAWHDHVNHWLDAPCFQNGRGLLVRYEDMKRDAHRELQRCAEFLEFDATDEQIAKSVAAGSFDKMRKTEGRTDLIVHKEKGPAISFVRKGIVGDWQNYFSPQDLERFNAASHRAMDRLGYATVDQPLMPARPACNAASEN
jgi:hypothetical protein